MISTQRTVPRSDKYVHILVLIVRLNRSTTAAFYSLSLAKCWIPWRFIRVWKFELKNYLSLSVWVRNFEHLPESHRDCLGVLGVNRHRPGEFGKYINHGEKVPHFAVLPGDTLHIGQVGLPQRIDPRQIGVVPDEPTASWLVQRIGRLAF